MTPRTTNSLRRALPLAAGVICASVAGSFAFLWADALGLRLRGDQLFVSVARMDLLREPITAKLKSGQAVAFDFHLALWVGSRSSPRRRAFERFVVSYDLWEERYAVSTLRKPKSSAAGLTPRGVEQWCLERIVVPSVDLGGASTVWAKLDVRAVDPERDAELFTREGLSLTTLIDLVSRTNRSEEQHWSFDSGAVPASLLHEDPRPERAR
ncbi:MAG: hypothetical protein U0Q16_21680 [Bryobacteraceae bacterium]